MNTVKIDQETAHAVLWWFTPRMKGALQPGSFMEALLGAAARADTLNTARLARGFPQVVAAVRMVQNDPDGLEELQRVALGIRAE